MKSGIQTIPLLLLIVLSGIALAAESEPIGWKKATSLFQRSKKGETLNTEEQAYLAHAKKERQKKAQASRGDDATRGDSGRERHTGGVAISEVVSPVETLKVTASDGNEMSVVWRKPPGVGPFPTVITIHGGANQQKVEGLKREALKNPIRTRLLAAGYLVVTSTFRTYRNEMQSRGPILDNLAVIEAVNKLPGVDPESVVVYGGSGGGNITLELAGETSFAAGIAGEPATIIYTGMLQKLSEKGTFMSEPEKHYTAELKSYTEAKIAKIQVPLLILHGDLHPLKKINHELVIPALKSAKKEIAVEVWPGKQHGFYWGKSMDNSEIDKLLAQIEAFLMPKLKTKPVAIATQ